MPVIRGSRCLDLFAGSGALGFEAASRGADHVTMIESDRTLATLLEEHRQKLSATEVQVIPADALRWVDTANDVFDIIFLDPPFANHDLGAICAAVESRGLVAPSGHIYLEHDAKMAPPSLPSTWARYRSQRAGQVRYDLAVRSSSGETV